MTAKQKIQALIKTLTLGQAKEWEATDEKFTWVDYNVLSANDLNCSDTNVNLVERQFERLLKNNHA